MTESASPSPQDAFSPSCDPTLSPEEKSRRLDALGSSWAINSLGHLTRCYPFHDFLEPLTFANNIAVIAEEMAHHPDLTIRWGRCEVEIWSHDTADLGQKDFTLATRIEKLYHECA